MLKCNCIVGFVSGVVLSLPAEPHLNAAISIALTPSVNSSAPLGTVVRWSTTVNDTGSGTLWYRFRSGELSAAARRRPAMTRLHLIVDYGPDSSLDWTEMDHEGMYVIEASVEDKSTGETATATASFEMTSRLVTPDKPVISPTNNPLVFLYSAPACKGGRMRVQFESPDGTVTNTPYQNCHAPTSMNFYLAGMRAQTPYRVHHTLETASNTVEGASLTVTTGSISIKTPNYNVFMPPVNPAQGGILLQCGVTLPTMATDLLGNVVWYYAGPISITTHAEAGGYFLGITENGSTDASHEYFIKYDVAGTTLLETNAARISEQLESIGERPINAFHHEAAVLPGGRYLLLADTEQILTDRQGPGQVDVIGDKIIVLDSNLQVLWAWDAFDHLDTSRMAVLDETCPSGAGCAPYHLSKTAHDWVHGNSLQVTPDGHILYSSRHQDMLFKINYDGGRGDGNIIWRLGLNGDFQVVSSDPSPWFSHQHDARIQQTDAGLILSVFDDGNTRVAANPDDHSRGQVMKLDEQNRVATLLVNADLGVYSYALGAAQRLSNGNFHFDAGWISQDPLTGASGSRSVEVDAAGNVVYGIAITAPEYRTFRMPDLYTP